MGIVQLSLLCLGKNKMESESQKLLEIGPRPFSFKSCIIGVCVHVYCVCVCMLYMCVFVYMCVSVCVSVYV